MEVQLQEVLISYIVQEQAQYRSIGPFWLHQTK